MLLIPQLLSIRLHVKVYFVNATAGENVSQRQLAKLLKSMTTVDLPWARETGLGHFDILEGQAQVDGCCSFSEEGATGWL